MLGAWHSIVGVPLRRGDCCERCPSFGTYHIGRFHVLVEYCCTGSFPLLRADNLGSSRLLHVNRMGGFLGLAGPADLLHLRRGRVQMRRETAPLAKARQCTAAGPTTLTRLCQTMAALRQSCWQPVGAGHLSSSPIPTLVAQRNC